jgi:1-acyl-sn-glycerol-3-phosphate acyltransferase
MIYPKHSAWAKKVFDPYVGHLLKRNFSHFYAVNNMPQPDVSCATLITPNHFSWWDGFFIYYLLNNRSRNKFHLMMLEEQLRRFWFFAKVGAYSIEPSNPVSVARSFAYTSALLKENGNTVVLYPQGKIEPYDKRPLEIQQGFRRLLAKSGNFKVQPVVFKIGWHNEMKPEVYFFTGNSFDYREIESGMKNLEQEMRQCLDMLDEHTQKRSFSRDLFERE